MAQHTLRQLLHGVFLDERLTSAEKSVLAVLALHLPNVEPGHARIAQMAGICERSVRGALEQLKKKGLVSWRHERMGARQGANHYFLWIEPRDLHPVQPATVAASSLQPAIHDRSAGKGGGFQAAPVADQGDRRRVQRKSTGEPDPIAGRSPSGSLEQQPLRPIRRSLPKLDQMKSDIARLERALGTGRG